MSIAHGVEASLHVQSFCFGLPFQVWFLYLQALQLFFSKYSSECLGHPISKKPSWTFGLMAKPSTATRWRRRNRRGIGWSNETSTAALKIIHFFFSLSQSKLQRRESYTCIYESLLQRCNTSNNCNTSTKVDYESHLFPSCSKCAPRLAITFILPSREMFWLLHSSTTAYKRLFGPLIFTKIFLRLYKKPVVENAKTPFF